MTGTNEYFTNFTGINTWISTITGGTGYFSNGVYSGDVIKIGGYASLPVSVSSYILYLASGRAGGDTAVGRIYCGDGSGFSFKISKRTSSTDTDWYIFNDNGTLNLTSTTNSSSTGSGALIVAGGAGFNGNIYASGNLVSTAGNIYGWTHYGGNISSNPWYISSNGSDMFLNATNIYLRCNASNESINLGDTGGFRIYLYLPTFCESTFSGTTGYFGNLLTSAGGISGTTSYNSGTGWFAGGLTGNAGYFTSLTGTNSYLSVITGNTGYFTNVTGTNGYFTSLTGTTTYMTSQFVGGITANTGFFTTLTGTNSYVSIETGGTGYFTNMTGSNGFFTTFGCSGITGSVVAYTGDVQTATSNTKMLHQHH